MADEVTKLIKKIKLSNGEVYYIYDMDAARASELDNYIAISGGTMTGDLTVDAAIKANNLTVTEIDDCDISITNVLTQTSNGIIKKRSVDYILEDIGGSSFNINEASGVLSLKFGKQTT